MFRTRAFILSVSVFLALAFSSPALGQSRMTYIYNRPESARDTRYAEAVDMLRLALEETKSKFGPYTLKPSIPMSEARQELELAAGSGNITVLARGASTDYEQALFPVKIPTEKGLLGYRVFLIRKQEQWRLGKVKTLPELRTFTIGQGLGWKDVDILRANGFTVTTGSSYEGLFDMLASNRFDLFSRSVIEVLDEYRQRKGKIKDLALERTILLYYPHPRFFWFTKSAAGRKLAARVEAGMKMSFRDGSYDRVFFRHYRHLIRDLDLKHRKLFILEDPFSPPDLPFSVKEYWFNPSTGR